MPEDTHVQVACRRCDTQAPPGRDQAEAEEAGAREQPFERRAEGWVCPECQAEEPRTVH